MQPTKQRSTAIKVRTVINISINERSDITINPFKWRYTQSVYQYQSS